MLVTAANACFCRLFGGDVPAMGLVAAATFVGFFVRQEMSTRHANHMAIFLICSFIASLINSIFDLLEGHVLVGISRAVNALILIVCIALGLSATLLILGLDTL